MPQSYVLFDNVCKYYQMGDTRIAASDHVSFEIQKGEFCVILGPSGAGKTTVLNMLGGMDTCDEGTILLDGEKVSGFDKKRLTTYRRYDVGFVFQFYNLGPDGPQKQLPRPAFRRRTAACLHRPCAGQKPKDPAL